MVLKGRGFSRAVSTLESIATLEAAEILTNACSNVNACGTVEERRFSVA
jgi:hypothetical protein